MRVEVMEMVPKAQATRKWMVRIRKAAGDLDVVAEVSATSPHEAFLKAARKAGVWPKRAGAFMEHFPGGHTYWVYPAWKVGNATSIGDRYVARIVPVEEVQG